MRKGESIEKMLYLCTLYVRTYAHKQKTRSTSSKKWT